MDPIKRIGKEFKALQQSNPYKVEVKNGNVWEAKIQGPKGSPYEGGIFVVHITFPKDYPLKPPKFIFKTKIYHPNIDSSSGETCLDFNDWSPAKNAQYILIKIENLLLDPNPDEPLEPHIAEECLKHPAKYLEVARKWTSQYSK
mgnify:CR=1 FL=1